MVSVTLIDYVVQTVLCIILNVVSILILIKACKTIKTKSNENISTSFKISYLSVLILCTLWFFTIIVHGLMFTTLNLISIDYNGYLFCKIYYPFQFLIFIGYETSVLNYFAVRIKQLLSNPKLQRYKFPKWMIPCYQISNILSAILTMIMTSVTLAPIIVNPVTESADLNRPPSNWSYCASINSEDDVIKLPYVLTVYCIWIIMMNILILLLLINRFYLMIKDRFAIHMDMKNTSGQTHNIQSDEVGAIVHIMKKQTLLVSIAITSTIVLWLITFNLPYAVSAFVTDHIVTEICVFLSFGSFEKYYKLLGCEWYESKCCKCIDNAIEAKLNMEFMKRDIQAQQIEVV